MKTLMRPLGRPGLKKAVGAFGVLGAFFVALFYGLEHSITVLSNAGVPEAYRRAFENEVLLLRLTASGVALCGVAVGFCIATVYFLWRTGLQAQDSAGFTPVKQS
ncbi:MAG: hypothetical protein FJ395_10385 [Verrucomicrobia bacterium]|nr:hypothetical protein [Verrucomicrobiota bacterium]